MRKRFLVLLVVLVSLFSNAIHAYAHIPCMCNNPPDQCTCFIQLGDKGLAEGKIIERLIKIGYLNKSVKKKVFTPEVKQAVLQLQKDNSLECTGWMDDETLNVLLRNVLPDESSKHSAHYWDGIYYVPTDGGIRFHSDPYCCGMNNPRMISGVNAESLGLQHCGWDSCISYDTLLYSSLGLTPRSLPASYYEEEENEKGAAIQRFFSPDDMESTFIGNRKSHIFHRPGCSAVNRMSEKNRVEFPSRDVAIEKGYKPCEKCNP